MPKTEKPAAPSKVFNLNEAMRDSEQPTEDEVWAFELDGEEFTLPLGDGLNWNAVAQFQAGDLAGGLEALLGAEQYARFLKHNVPLRGVHKLFEVYAERFNSSLGE